MPVFGKKFSVIGVGRYGQAIATILSSKGAEVYAFDSDDKKIEAIKDDVSLAVSLDASDKEALASQYVHESDCCVVAIGENFEAVILCCVNLMELGAKRIIARASSEKQKLILSKLGITEILSPEEEVGKVVAEQLINPSLLSFLELPDDYEIAEVKTPKSIVNKTVGQIGMRDKYQITLITLKREFEVNKDGEKVIEQHVLGVPTSNTKIYETDTLVVFGTTKNIERLIEINQ